MKYQAILLAVTLVAAPLHAAREQPEKNQAVAPGPTHVDPLGGAHGGADPHAALSPDQQVKVALQHRKEGRLPEAVKVMQESLLKFPDHAQSHAVMSDLQRQNGELAKALASIEQAIALDDTAPLYYVNRALLYVAFKRPEEALKDLDHAVEMDGDLIAARFNRGSLYAQHKDYERAMKDFDHCIAVDPHLPAPYFNRGSVRYSLGLTQFAKDDIRHFIKLSKNENWKKNAEELLASWEKIENRLSAQPQEKKASDTESVKK